MKVRVELNKRSGCIKPVWNMGFNTCHAPLLLRKDLMEHIKEAKRIGFKYIRFHNIFARQLGIYSESEMGEVCYDFTKFDAIFDRILQNGLLPFFEISFCPEALKKSDKSICFYKANTSIPKSYDRWNELVKILIRHAVERYGLECVKQWYFEVWNEPDLIFFDGEMEDYFELYDNTALAVKSVCEDLRVGGPATSKCAWIKDFIEHVEKGSSLTGYKRVPCDFISTHVYPSDVAFMNSDEGEVKLQESNIMVELFSKVRQEIDSSSLKGLPLFMGEWNSSAGPLSYNHDEKNNGAFIVKSLIEMRNIIDGSLYWNLSDIYEECNFHYTPFHGGYGLLNVNTIQKSSYNAFSLLNEMKGEELELINEDTQKGCGAFAAYDSENSELSIILYNYTEPGAYNSGPAEIILEIHGIGKSCAGYNSKEINSTTGSPYEWWRKIGSPEYLTPETMLFLAGKSKMEEEEKLVHGNEKSDYIELNEVIMPGDVKLIKLTNFLGNHDKWGDLNE